MNAQLLMGATVIHAVAEARTDGVANDCSREGPKKRPASIPRQADEVFLCRSPNQVKPPDDSENAVKQKPGALDPMESDRKLVQADQLSAAARRGNVTVASRPPPSRFRSQSAPPCATAMSRAMLRPRPTPPEATLRESSCR